jgi:DNA-directed RNA polymerase specialized sigma24 family protein
VLSLSQLLQRPEYRVVTSQLSYSDVSDAELLIRTVAEPDAFGELYDRFEAGVLAFFYRATRRAEIAADLTAETFAAALASSRTFDPNTGSARSWLFGIARHQLANAWERGRRRLEGTR